MTKEEVNSQKETEDAVNYPVKHNSIKKPESAGL